jgi:transposase
VSSSRWSNGKKKGVGNRKNGNKYLAWAFVEASHYAARFNPNFAIGRGIRRRMRDNFFLKKFARSPRYALTFFVDIVSASSVSMLTPIAKCGFNERIRRFYQRKKAKTNGAVAVKSVAHKLARACYHVIKDQGEAYKTAMASP